MLQQRSTLSFDHDIGHAIISIVRDHEMDLLDLLLIGKPFYFAAQVHHRTIALLPDREPATVEAWMVRQTQIGVVARDCGGA